MSNNNNNSDNDKRHTATWRYKKDGGIKIRVVFAYRDHQLKIRLQSKIGLLFHKTIYKRKENIMYLYVKRNQITEPESEAEEEKYFYYNYKPENVKSDFTINELNSDHNGDDDDDDESDHEFDSLNWEDHDLVLKKRHFKRSIAFILTWKKFLKQNGISFKMVRKKGIEYDSDTKNSYDWSLAEDIDTDQSDEFDDFYDEEYDNDIQ
jgi:hypothetical protein